MVDKTKKPRQLGHYKKKMKIHKHLYHDMINILTLILKWIIQADKDSLTEHKIKNFLISTTTIILKPFLNKKEWKRTSNTVKKFYDNYAGQDTDFINSETRQLYYINDKPQMISNKEFYTIKGKEIYTLLSNHKFKNILEVGAGELLILKEISNKYKSNIKYHATDLSYKRLLIGKKSFNYNISIKQANAIKLPYKDNTFDMVITHHCLEQIPYDYKQVINEIIRVSKSTIILLEPTYELSTISQKLYMKAHDYVKGLYKYLNSRQNIVIINYYMSKNTDLFNRTGIYIIKKL